MFSPLLVLSFAFSVLQTSKIVQTRQANPCSSGTDCADTECCVSNFQPGGKRLLLIMNGHCEPIGTFGSGCYVRYGSGKPSSMVFSCPCQTGLTCHGTGSYDAQLGEYGKCI